MKQKLILISSLFVAMIYANENSFAFDRINAVWKQNLYNSDR